MAGELLKFTMFTTQLNLQCSKPELLLSFLDQNPSNYRCVWLDHESQRETSSLILSASPHTTRSCCVCFLIMSWVYPLLPVTTITCLYCFSYLFNCSQFSQCRLPPIHFLQGSQKDSFKWGSDCVPEILQWLAPALGLKIKDIHLAFTSAVWFHPLFSDGPEPGSVLAPLPLTTISLPSFLHLHPANWSWSSDSGQTPLPVNDSVTRSISPSGHWVFHGHLSVHCKTATCPALA